MTTRMEIVAEKLALSVLQVVSSAMEPSLPMDRLQKNFYARWPTEGSRFPINDAMLAARNAAIACKERTCSGWDEDQGTWRTPIVDAWDKAVAETVAQYFDNARSSFAEGKALEGTEILTDAVRAALGFIAATREWPHGTLGELYNVAEGLASGVRPNENGNVFEYPDTMSEEGVDLCSFFAASMGRPDSVKFGFYGDNEDAMREDAFLFASKAIELARRIAKDKAALT